jgi:iron-sulfur cluster repair protein YtfE (RIC family)
LTSELIALIDRLASEHVEVARALDTIGSAIDQEDEVALRAALLAGNDALGTGLDVHSSDEDEVLFPGVAAVIGEAMVSVFTEEHVRIIALRDQAYERMSQGVADFQACADLCELLGNHIEREDEVLFPAVRALLAD